MKTKNMRNAVLSLMTLSVSIGYSQVSPIDFEAGGNGADWTWTVFENNTNPAVEIIDNPDKTGINPSDKVLKFTTEVGGKPWAGMESERNELDFVFDANNSTVKIMVWKSNISDVGIKFAAWGGGWSKGEIKVANTKINEWEELTFDFSNLSDKGEAPPTGEGGKLTQIIIFPDFIPGTGDRIASEAGVAYIDFVTFFGEEITLSTKTLDLGKLSIYPNPANDVLNINAYSNIEHVSIINLVGQNVLTVSPNQINSTIDLNSLHPGVYFVKATIQGITTTSKFIKE
jgi:hypothetical protein